MPSSPTKNNHQTDMASGMRKSTTQLWLLSSLALFFFTSLADGSQMLVMSAPNVLRVGRMENIFVECQDCSGDEDVFVEISVMQFPTKAKLLASASVNLTKTNKFQAFGKIKIPDGDFSKDPYITQHVYLRARFPDVELEKVILVSFQFGYIFIQTDKTLYTPNSKVHYRIFALTPHMEAVQRDFETKTDVSIAIDIVTPDGIIIALGQVSVKSGVYSGDYQLGEVVSPGLWKVVAGFHSKPQMSFSANFEVKEYVLPSFEVKLIPKSSFFYINSEDLTVNIKAEYMYDKMVDGTAFGVFGVVHEGQKKSFPSSLQRVVIEKGDGSVTLKREHITQSFPNVLDLVGSSIYVAVSVLTDNGSEMAEAELKNIPIVTSSYTIHFKKTPKFFKPGVSFDVSIEVTNPDGTPAQGVPLVVDKEEVEGITAANGVAMLSINTVKNSEPLIITAKTTDPNIAPERQASASMTALPYSSSNDNFIHIGVGRPEVTLGDNLKINLNFNQRENAQNDITTLILSRGQLVRFGRYWTRGQTLLSLIIPIYDDIMPSFRIIAYYHTPENEVVSDSVWVDVKDSCLGSLKLEPVNPAVHYEPRKMFGLKVTGDPGAIVGLVAVDKGVYVLNNQHRLTQKKVWDTVEEYDTGCTPGGGKDSMSVFYDAGLVFESNTGGGTPFREGLKCPAPSRTKRTTDVMNITTILVSLYEDELQRECCMDGIRDTPVSYPCERRSEYIVDGASCVQAFLHCCEEMAKQRAEKRKDSLKLGRSEEDNNSYVDSNEIVSRTKFPESWLWTDLKLSNCFTDNCESSSFQKRFPLQDSITKWMFTGISLSNTLGICVAEPLEVIVRKNFFVDLTLPYSVVRGEQIEIKAVLHNYQSDPVTVRVDLLEVENVCSSASRRGKYRQEVKVGAQATQAVPFVIIPTEVGEFPIEIKAAVKDSPLSDGIMKLLLVVPEGFLIKSPQIVTLDPENKGVDGKQVEVINSAIPKIYLLPNTPTSTQISVTGKEYERELKNDIGGAPMGGLVYQPSGCGEENMIHMTLPLIATTYLDKSNQWDPVHIQRRYEALQHISTGYHNQLQYRNKDGSFAKDSDHQSSTWLTAYVVRVFTMAKNLVLVQKEVICDAVKFLVVKTQQSNGMFSEIGRVSNREMTGDVYGTDSDASITAFCLIAMQDSHTLCASTVDNLPESIDKAVSYLEKRLPSLIHPYAIAMASCALASENKLNQEILYTFASPDFSHWPVPGGRAYTLEATAYSLMALVRAKALKQAKPIVRWFNKQRRSEDGGYGSTQATMMVYQAVAEYWANANEKDYDLNVDILLPSRSKPYKYNFNNDNHYSTRTAKANNINQDVEVTATGTGEATLTMVSLYYALPTEREGDCFTFNMSVMLIPEKMDDDEKIYQLKIKVLFKDKERDAAMTVLDIGLLTGFTVNTKDLDLMISKSAGSPDVHELILSKEDFERKEKNKEDIYSTTIKNRKPGDSSHVKKNDERFLRELIAEEKRKESFTAVVITGVQAEHVKYLKQDFKDWTRRLAHIYHYYIHGVSGNDLERSSTNPDLSNIDIQVTLREKPPKIPHVINLREVEDDLQTLFINAAADTFEFKASEPDGGTVEGILRYHPFLYDRETYPLESPAPVPAPEAADSDDEDDVDDEPGALARGKRPVFECFWNGRLIPYTKIDILDWCTRPKGGDVPPECYSRFSGVLFTDDKFEVSTTKLTFSDLELKLRRPETIFSYVVNEKKPQRANIQSKFTDWVKKCHARFDKQVKFLGSKGVISRMDVQVKKRQHPWSTFTKIECGNNIYKAGQLIKSKNTSPVYCGEVIRFLVYGVYKEGDFATGGQVEVALEPKGLYDKSKIIPISKIDTLATDDSIQKNIESNSAKLPDKLKVEWPDKNVWSQNDVHPAGAKLGPLNVYILNNKEEILSNMPTLGKSRGTTPNVKLRILYHGPKDLEEVATFTASYLPKWSFWFKKNENLTKLGKYTLILNAVVNDKTNYGGRELPSYTLDFSLEAGAAHSFIINVTSPTIQVGVPFDLPLTIRDFYCHVAKPPPDVQPVLTCSDLDVTYESVKTSETSFIIKKVIARGKVEQTKTYNMSVTLPGLKRETKVMDFSVLPGPSRSLHVTPDDSPITVENGNPVRFNVEIHDEAGNITACPDHVVHCQGRGLPPVVVDCSRTGAAQLETKPIKLKIINGKPQKLKVQLNIPSQRKIKSVTRELMVVPSTRVSVMKLYSEDDENLVLRDNEKIEWLAGGLLENLVYKLYDEAGREVPITSEIASMIKVNWTGDLVLEDLLVGKLPDLQVPMRVQEERFYQVSYQDQCVSVSFTITPRPDEPARLKATIPQNRVKLGETLSTNINLELVDQYGNVTNTLDSTCVNSMTVKAADLDQSAVTFIWQESSRSVDVAGVCFQGGTPGPRELCFTYASYVESAIVTVTAGDPAELKLVSGPDQPLQVINDHGIPKPFLVQLVDKWGNPSSDQRVVVEVKVSPPALKVTTTVTSQPVDAEGKASFTVTSVSGTKGYYQLNFTGSLNMKPVPGPSVNLIVLPNPKKAVSLSVEYDTSATFPAGGTFPLFSVTVVSDEGSPMNTFSPAAMSMRIWSGVSSEGPLLFEMKCNKPLENERKDSFHFRDKEIPEQVGKYSIQFHLNTKTTVLESKQIIINVVANQPLRLRPDSNPQHPVVSFSKDVAKRTLVQNMTLRIMDAYGNPAGQELDGTVVVSIKNSNGESEENLLFEDRRNTQCLKLEEGKVHIPRLAIMEDCPGEDGRAYTLLFTPEVPMVPQALEPYELPFHFYNDEANQRKMSELSKKKEELTSAVSKYSGFFNESKQLLQLLTVQHKAANRHISEIKQVLDTKKMKIAQASSIRDIDRFINEKRAEAERILQMSRRIFSVRDPFRGLQGVLGMVGRLAYVEDDAAAHMISWNLRGYMDCVITTTTESAMRIHRDTQGRQKVMALESIFVHQSSRPLPHIRNHHKLFDPPGNPVFARELLIFPHYKQECEIVFKNILGDTILIDDLASANQYRKQVVQNKIPCPTILTRQGDLVSAKGMFGGSQNKAPPIHTLLVFGSPPPQEYYAVREQIDLAHQYQVAMEKHLKAVKEYDEHLTVMNSPDTLKKKEDMEVKRRQLEMIEGQLASTPVRQAKRAFPGSGEPSAVERKRSRHRPI